MVHIEPIPITTNVHSTVGAVFVGYAVATLLFGVSTVQLYIYLQRLGRDDSRRLKILVVVFWFTEFVHQIMVSIAVYGVCVIAYGHLEAIVKTPLPFNLSIILGSFMAAMYQGYFTHRLWGATHNIWILVLLVTLICVRFIANFVAGALCFTMKDIPSFLAEFEWLFIVLFVTGASADLLISAFLAWDLYVKRPTALYQSQHIIDKLILFAVGTGSLTSITAFSVMICFITMRYNWVWIGLFCFFPRLFSNSLLALLNSRRDMRKALNSKVIGFKQRSNPIRRINVNDEDKSQSIAIEMTTEIIRVEDEDPYARKTEVKPLSQARSTTTGSAAGTGIPL